LPRAGSKAALLFVLLTAGCACVEPATHAELDQAGPTLAVVSELPSPLHPAGATQGGVVAAEPEARSATLPPTLPAGQSVARTAPTGAKISPASPESTAPFEPLPKKVSAAPAIAKPQASPTSPGSAAPLEPLPKKESAAPAVAKPQAAPPLDLASLENRLKDTKAIGLFTKIALKNQVDDLLNQFRAYYQGSVKTTLAQLRQRYDLLLLKVLSLLQDSDQALATAIGSSREALWGILADRQKFATI